MKVNPDAEPNSETWIECLEYSNHWAKYRLSPKTGKQHQLRVHLAHLGLAIQNDPLYPFWHTKPTMTFPTPYNFWQKNYSLSTPLHKLKCTFAQDSHFLCHLIVMTTTLFLVLRLKLQILALE